MYNQKSSPVSDTETEAFCRLNQPSTNHETKKQQLFKKRTKSRFDKPLKVS